MAEQLNASLSMWLDGVAIEDVEDRVLRVEVDERASEASSFRMVLSMAPGQDGQWDLLQDGGHYSLLKRITIALAVGPQDGTEVTAERVVFDGFITVMEPTFAAQRVPESTLELRGLDASCLMHLEARLRTWQDVADSTIVSTIFQDYGFAVDVDDEGPTRHARVGSMHQRCTDAEFVRQLARRHGWECNLRPAASARPTSDAHPGTQVVGHFHPPRVGETQAALSLEPHDAPSLIELRARWDSHRPTRIDGWHIDARSRRMQTATWPRADGSRPHVPKQGRYSRQELLSERLSLLTRSRSLIPRGFQASLVPHDAAELGQLAWADHLETDWLAEADGVVQGLRYDNILQPGRSVPIQGGGELINGDWYVRSARHRWEAGQATQAYEIDVHLLRNAIGEVV